MIIIKLDLVQEVLEWHKKIEVSRVRLNINMWYYKYRDSHVKDKTVSRPSYLYYGNPHTWKDGLYMEMGPWIWSNYVMILNMDHLGIVYHCLQIAKNRNLSEVLWFQCEATRAPFQ